jgi:hypothetical protein
MGKTLLGVITALMLTVGPMTAAPMPIVPDLDQLTNALSTFAAETPKALPFAAGAGIDWSQAYIGNLIDGNFPFIHLGVGAQVGATTIPSASVVPLLGLIRLKLPPGLAFLPLPFVVANARLGGLIIPFDIGIKAGFLPQNLQNAVPGYTFGYQNFGIDARFPLVRENFLLPTISVGGGLSLMRAMVQADQLAQDVVVTTSALPGRELTLTAPTLIMELGAYNVEAKIQISKNILWLFTPYLGASVAYGKGTAQASLESTIADSSGDLSYWKNHGLNIDPRGIHRQGEFGSLALKAYGGMSLDVLILKVDAQAMYDILSEAMGASIGVRLQL